MLREALVLNTFVLCVWIDCAVSLTLSTHAQRVTVVSCVRNVESMVFKTCIKVKHAAFEKVEYLKTALSARNNDSTLATPLIIIFVNGDYSMITCTRHVRCDVRISLCEFTFFDEGMPRLCTIVHIGRSGYLCGHVLCKSNVKCAP